MAKNDILDDPRLKDAKKELELLGMDKDDAQLILIIVLSFMDLTATAFEPDKDVYMDIIKTLVKGKNITPLTNNPQEWKQVTPTLWRNKRNNDAFSSDGGLSFWLTSERRSNNTAPTHMSNTYIPPPLPPEPPVVVPVDQPEEPLDG